MSKKNSGTVKEKISKNKNGITLIALIITIIVMLILVAVTITVAVNGGLFNYAKKAHDNTIEARDKELEYTTITADDWTYEDLIDKYTVKNYVTFCILDENWNATAEINIDIPSEEITWEEFFNIIDSYPELVQLQDEDVCYTLNVHLVQDTCIEFDFITKKSVSWGTAPAFHLESDLNISVANLNEHIKSGDVYIFLKDGLIL